MYGYLDSDGLVHRCCVCRKIRYNDGKYRILRLPDYIWRISDGYCKPCLRSELEAFERYYQGQGGVDGEENTVTSGAKGTEGSGTDRRVPGNQNGDPKPAGGDQQAAGGEASDQD